MRLMTYNIRGGLGMDGRRDTSCIAQVVADQVPDIVCFQEIHQRLPWSGWIDQPRRLGQALGQAFIFQANVRYLFGGYGVGVATRLPVQSVSRHPLPSRGESRGALEVVLKAPDGPLTVFCTHWGLKRDERQGQAEKLATLVRSATGSVIVCGDLNETPDADYIQKFLQTTGLRDWGRETGLPTYPTDAPVARIDVVFAAARLVLDGICVVQTQASDHLPLVVDFRSGVHDGGF